MRQKRKKEEVTRIRNLVGELLSLLENSIQVHFSSAFRLFAGCRTNGLLVLVPTSAVIGSRVGVGSVNRKTESQSESEAQRIRKRSRSRKRKSKNRVAIGIGSSTYSEAESESESESEA